MVKTAIAVGAAGVATAASLLTLSLTQNARVHRQEIINQAVCESIQSIDHSIRLTLEQTLRTLPTISYYQHHPAELADQQRQTMKALEQFTPPKACASVVT